MRDAAKQILVIDGAGATAALAAMRLVNRAPDAEEIYAEADSCAPLKRVPDGRRYKPLDHAGNKHWNDTDPDYSDDTRQYDAEEEQIGPDELARRAIIRHPALVTVEGMQLYCFRRRLPYGPGAEEKDPHAQDPNHLEYWMRRLEENLSGGEKLDAIIIPSRLGPLQYEKLEPVLHHAKEHWPELQVIQRGERAMASPEGMPLIDHVVERNGKVPSGDAIRTILGVPPLAQHDPQAGYYADQANRRSINKQQSEMYLSPRYDGLRKPQTRGDAPDEGAPKGRRGRG